MKRQPDHAHRQPLLRIDDVAVELGKSRATVYRIIASGALPTIHVGKSGTIRVDPTDLDRYKRLNRVGEFADEKSA